MYDQRQTSSVAVRSFSGQRWVDLAFILALIAIVIVVVLSLIGPTIGNTVTSASSNLTSPAPALSTTDSEQGALTPATIHYDQAGYEVVSVLAR